MAIPCINTYDNIRFQVITVTAKDRKQLFINDRLNTLWYIHPIEFYAAKKGKRFLIPYILILNGEEKGQSKVYVVYHLCKKPMHTWLGTESCSTAYSKLLAVPGSRKRI